MKIVTYDEFIRMPAGTIFAKWEPDCYITDFEVKIDAGHAYFSNYTKKNEWYFNGTMPIYPHSVIDWTVAPINNYIGPVKSEMLIYDGSSSDYEERDLFAVMEEKDIRKMIEALEWALRGCTGEFDDRIPFEESEG